MKIRKKYIYLLVAILISIIPFFTPLQKLNYKAKATLSILLFSMVLWITVAIPLSVTSLMAALALVLFNVSSVEMVFKNFFDPVVVLLFGGFLLARALQKQRLDKRLCLYIITKFKKFKYVLLGLMFATAFLSFWISNTAATLVMIPVGLALLDYVSVKSRKKLAATLVLAIAYSATVGGIGTIIGTPPNLIAIRFLDEVKKPISFTEWSLANIPLVLILIPIIWIILFLYFKPKVFKISRKEVSKLKTKQKIVLIIFTLTVLLWITSKLPEFLINMINWKGHGISAPVVSLIGAILLFLTGTLGKEDFGKIDWKTLILFGGGLALANSVHQTKLSEWIISRVSPFLVHNPLIIVLLLLAILSITFTVIGSNTVSAAILIPVLLPLAKWFDLKLIIMLSAVANSLDFIFPIGTPPTAIAYSTGNVTAKEIGKVGFVLTVVSIFILIGLAYCWWDLII